MQAQFSGLTMFYLRYSNEPYGPTLNSDLELIFTHSCALHKAIIIVGNDISVHLYVDGLFQMSLLISHISKGNYSN
jgi:hypothetical protein